MTSYDMIEQLSGRRVLVTGANGFIGRYTVGALTGAGASVTALTRRRTTFTNADVLNVVARFGQNSNLEALVDGNEIVIHLAYDGMATAESNLAAFDRLYSAALKAGVQRFVHMSSIVVYDDWPNLDVNEQSSMTRSGGGAYRLAKMKMEQRVMEGTLPAIILQPTIVYGQGSGLWTDQFVEHLKTGTLVLPDPIGICNGVYVEDVVQACLRAAVVPGLEQERFIISGSETFSWADLLQGYAEMIGCGTFQYEPAELLRARFGSENEADLTSDELPLIFRTYAIGHRIFGRARFERAIRSIKRALARDSVVYPDQHLLSVLCASGRCEISKATDRLGYEPVFNLPKSLEVMKPLFDTR